MTAVVCACVSVSISNSYFCVPNCAYLPICVYILCGICLSVCMQAALLYLCIKFLILLFFYKKVLLKSESDALSHGEGAG